MSRASRLATAANGIEAVVKKLEDIKLLIKVNKSVDEINNLIDDFNNITAEIDTTDVEDIMEELDNWKSGLEGTNLENTEKYTTLSEAIDTLTNVIDNLSESEDINYIEKINDKKKLIDSIDDKIGKINETIGEIENVECPGAFR